MKYNIRTSYKTDYKDLVENPVDIKTFVLIANGFLKFMMLKLWSRGEIMIPERLGNILIRGHKSNIRVEDGKLVGAAPDWASTKKLWQEDEEARTNKQLVYFFNEHTQGIRYSYKWSKSRVLCANKTLYSLRMSRFNKRKLSSLIKEGHEYLIK